MKLKSFRKGLLSFEQQHLHRSSALECEQATRIPILQIFKKDSQAMEAKMSLTDREIQAMKKRESKMEAEFQETKHILKNCKREVTQLGERSI